MVQTTDPSAPDNLEVELHVYKDDLGNIWYRESLGWPSPGRCRYQGLYKGVLKVKEKAIAEVVRPTAPIKQELTALLQILASRREAAERRLKAAGYNDNHMGQYIASAEIEVIKEIEGGIKGLKDMGGRHIKVDREALLIVFRVIDLGAVYSEEQLNYAFDKIRGAFTPEEIATGVTNSGVENKGD